MPDADPRTAAVECQTCKDTGMAWQWRTYGDRQYHGNYYEPCDDCARGKEIAEARRGDTSVPEHQTTITCFMAAICRDLTEGGNGYRYFGSLGAWTTHQRQAIRAGLLTADGNLTAVGRRVGDACRDIPADRAYAYSEAYEAAAMSALKEQH